MTARDVIRLLCNDNPYVRAVIDNDIVYRCTDRGLRDGAICWLATGDLGRTVTVEVSR